MQTRSPQWPGLAAAAIIGQLIAAAPMLGHTGHDDVSWSTWNADPLPAIGLGVVTLVYSLGVARLWRHAGRARGLTGVHLGAFAAGMLALAAALISPIDTMADALNWVHMVQHMLIMMIAAPLFVLGAPGVAAIWALPAHRRPAAGRALAALERWRIRRYVLWQPIALWVLFALTLWVWHLPRLYEAALRVQRVHDLQHIAFFVSACLFWRVLLDPLSRLRMNPALGVLYLFTTSLHATLLGVFMALAPRAWYAWYSPRTQQWGLSVLEDQQLAGFIMWMPACLVYAIAAALLFGLWLGRRDGGAITSLPSA